MGVLNPTWKAYATCHPLPPNSTALPNTLFKWPCSYEEFKRTIKAKNGQKTPVPAQQPEPQVAWYSHHRLDCKRQEIELQALLVLQASRALLALTMLITMLAL
eukprot:1161331-Pelagomonas_calceolata.AAC.7